MGIKDEFQNKAEQHQDQAKKARSGAPDKTSKHRQQAEARARQGQEQVEDDADNARDRFQS